MKPDDRGNLCVLYDFETHLRINLSTKLLINCVLIVK